MAFVTETDIANMAVAHVGGKSKIENLTTSKDEAARLCRLWYHPSREQVLEAYDWNFARHRIGLTLFGEAISTDSTQPWAGVWGYRYSYPADCIIVRKLQNAASPPEDATPFEIELSPDGSQKTILTDLPDAVAVYTRNVTITSLFSSLFAEALSHLLASKIAFSITGKTSTAKEQLKVYQDLLPAATAANANEQMGSPPRDADWIRAR